MYAFCLLKNINQPDSTGLLCFSYAVFLFPIEGPPVRRNGPEGAPDGILSKFE